MKRDEAIYLRKTTRLNALGLVWALAALLLLAAPARAALDYARPSGPVGDYADLIPAQYRQAIAAASAELFQKTGDALVVATIPSLDGDTIEEAGYKLYEKWGIGKKGDSRGVLFLVAKKERKLRIEVGYGLEGLITDATAGAIRDQAMVPYLKKNEFGKGLYAGVAATAQIIAKERGVQLTGVPDVKVRQRSGGLGMAGLFVLIALVMLWGRIMRRRGGRGGGGGLLGAMVLGSMMGSGSRGGGGFDSFGGGFGGFGGGMSGGGGASGGF